MRPKTNLLIILLPLLLIFNSAELAKNKYILLEYGGIQDKPISTIVFYSKSHKNIEKSEYKIYEYYKTNHEDFESIVRAIVNSTIAKKTDNNKICYYGFSIDNAGEVVKYETPDKQETTKLLNEILASIKSTKLKREVGKSFQDITYRIW